MWLTSLFFTVGGFVFLAWVIIDRIKENRHELYKIERHLEHNDGRIRNLELHR